jgi:hypothetical protein
MPQPSVGQRRENMRPSELVEHIRGLEESRLDPLVRRSGEALRDLLADGIR